MTVEGKVAIVTGAGQGIGLEIGSQLIRRGAKVILNDIDGALANDAATRIRDGKNCKAVPGDASQQAVIDLLVATAIRDFGKLDIVVANAGITLFGDFFSYSREAFSKVMQVNLAGSFFLAQAACRQMKQQQSGGALLFMSSVTGHQAHKDLAAYGMTKAAIEMLARNLVIEVSSFGINVNAIAPGATMTERTTLEDPNYKSTWSAITPLGKPATVSDIANAAVFLVSDEAKHITGQTIVIDGGWSAVSPSPYKNQEY